MATALRDFPLLITAVGVVVLNLQGLGSYDPGPGIGFSFSLLVYDFPRDDFPKLTPPWFPISRKVASKPPKPLSDWFRFIRVDRVVSDPLVTLYNG